MKKYDQIYIRFWWETTDNSTTCCLQMCFKYLRFLLFVVFWVRETDNQFFCLISNGIIVVALCFFFLGVFLWCRSCCFGLLQISTIQISLVLTLSSSSLFFGPNKAKTCASTSSLMSFESAHLS